MNYNLDGVIVLSNGCKENENKSGRTTGGGAGFEGREDVGYDFERCGDLYSGLAGTGGAAVGGWIDGVVEVRYSLSDEGF